MKKYLLLALFLFGISFAFAQCCFDLSNGLCTDNSDASSCSTQLFGGSCSGVSDCISGCCTLGSAHEYTTERECQVLSNSGGFDLAWQRSSAQECQAQQDSAAKGACVVQSRYENSCSIKTQGQCSGNFYANQFCTDPSFNTTCVQTQNSKCIDGSAYYLDSCGNQERVKETCDYEAGNICRQNNKTREAYCKSLNCENGKKNGDRWCVPPTGITDDLLPWQIIDGGLVTVGSRYFSQYCLNGEIVTEPCADYREELCKEGKCVANKYDDCIAANTGEEDPKTGLRYSVDECNTDSCIVLTFNDAAPCSTLTRLDAGTKGDCTRKPGVQESATEIKSAGGTVESEIENPVLTDLGIGVCAPQIAPGQNLDAKSEEGNCASGDYTAKVELKAHYDKSGSWPFGRDPDSVRWYVSIQDDSLHPYGYAGLISTDPNMWLQDLSNMEVRSMEGRYKNPLDKFIGKPRFTSTLPIDETVMMTLNNICQNMGDCVGKVNWVGSGGSAAGDEPVLTCKGDVNKRTCTLDFKCSSYKAPSGSSDCSKCGSDDLPCSEYRCKSLGKGCSYFEPAGIDKGYCVASNDNTPPTISHSQNPASPIGPFSPVTFTINTDEDSSCKFNLGSAGSKYESMQYAVDSEFGKTHYVTLTLPGARAVDDSEASSYQLISAGGNYSMYVRCEDAAGNWNLNSYLIKFNVMQAPDKVPPVISQYIPLSNAAVLFNTTNKSVSFKLNEPAECKWSLSDKNFTSMENNFSCDSEVNDYAVLHGYYCNGVLTNVTKNLTQSTNYFIRCKDQPWLEGKEDNLYSRNTNPTSFTYSLRPSQAFEITLLQPSGEVTVSNTVTNITLSATTRGGGYNGVANCSYRLYWNNTVTGFAQFRNTNSVTHTTVLTNKTEGDYTIEARCVDLAGNEQNKNSTIYFRYDTATPWIVRVYNDKGNIRFNTNENAVCRFVKSSVSNLACLNAFQQQNSTIMTGTNAKQHVTAWIKGISYYVKCKDFYNNEDSGCFIARAEK